MLTRRIARNILRYFQPSLSYYHLWFSRSPGTLLDPHMSLCSWKKWIWSHSLKNKWVWSGNAAITDHHTPPRGRGTQRQQLHGSKNKIKLKQPVLSSQNRVSCQSKLPRPFLRNSVESDHVCTSRINFDHADDDVTLTLYNVTRTSLKPW